MNTSCPEQIAGLRITTVRPPPARKRVRGTDLGSTLVALLFGEQLPSRLLGRYPTLSALDARGGLLARLSPPALYRRVLQVAGV